MNTKRVVGKDQKGSAVYLLFGADQNPLGHHLKLWFPMPPAGNA